MIDRPAGDFAYRIIIAIFGGDVNGGNPYYVLYIFDGHNI